MTDTVESKPVLPVQHAHRLRRMLAAAGLIVSASAWPAVAQTGEKPPFLTMNSCALQPPASPTTSDAPRTAMCQAEIQGHGTTPANDIQISVAGVPVEQSQIAPAPASALLTPTQWLIIVDLGVTGVRQGFKTMKTQAEAVINAIPNRDGVALVIVNGPVDPANAPSTGSDQPLTFKPAEQERNALVNVVRTLKPATPAPLYDTLCSAIGRLNASAGPRAAVVLTDGRDTGSRVCNADGVLARTSTLATPIFVIGVGSAADQTFLQALASNTGGSYIPIDLAQPDANTTVSSTVTAIQSSFRTPYAITFTLPLSLTATGPVTVSAHLTEAPSTESSTLLTLPEPRTLTEPQPAVTVLLTALLPYVIAGLAVIGLVRGAIVFIRRRREADYDMGSVTSFDPKPATVGTAPYASAAQPQGPGYMPMPSAPRPEPMSNGINPNSIDALPDEPTYIYRGNEAMALLQVMNGEQKDTTFPIGLLSGDVVKIGRKVSLVDGNIRLTSPFISGEHARVFADNGQLCLEDNGSASGTKVNGRKLRPHDRHEIQVGDQIEFANVMTTVREKVNTGR